MRFIKPIRVVKFGGTSVADPARLEKVAQRLVYLHKKYHLVVVVSAMAGVTNQLVSYCDQMAPSVRDPEVDVVLASGEQVTSGLLSLKLKQLGMKSCSVQGWQAPIKTSKKPTQARIESIDAKHILTLLDEDMIPIVAGFQGIDVNNKISTLGRGGSDTTAVALAAALLEESKNQDIACDIYTDVDGIYTADPRFVENAKKLKTIPATFMLELAQSGSKVLHPRCVQIALRYGVNVRVLSSFIDDIDQQGTLITQEKDADMEQSKVYGIAHHQNDYMVTLKSESQNIQKALKKLPNLALTTDLLTLYQGAESVLSFMILNRDFTILKDILKEDVVLSVETNKVKITLVGVGLQNDFTILSKIYDCVDAVGATIDIIHVSELKITLVTEQNVTSTLLEKLHKAFIS